MATASLEGSVSNASLASTSPTPSLSSISLVAPSNGTDSSVSSSVPIPEPSVASPPVVAPSLDPSVSPSVSDHPSVRSAAAEAKDSVSSSAAPMTKNGAITTTSHSTAKSSAQPAHSSLHASASSDDNNVSHTSSGSAPPHVTVTSTSTHSTSSTTHASSGSSATPKPSSTSKSQTKSAVDTPLTASQSTHSTVSTHSSSEATKVSSTSSKAATSTRSDSNKATSETSKATGTNSSTGANALASNLKGTPTNTFVPQISTSVGQVFTSKTSGPTGALDSTTQTSGFFQNHGAVAGVFVVVALSILGLVGLLYFALKRCRRDRHGEDTAQPTLPRLRVGSFDGDMHYRRASQMRALGDVLSAGASPSRPLSGRSIPSDDTHTFSHETYHSNEPINAPALTDPFMKRTFGGPSQERSEGYTNGYANVVPFPPFIPFANQSRFSVAETSPSIYPPTLPSVADEDEEEYWRRQGFEHVSDSKESSRIVEKHRAPQQQPTPPESSLGLWTNMSQSTLKAHTTSEENELVRSLDPRMQPSSVHKGTTAPISSPPPLHIHEGRYPSIGGWTDPNRRQG